MEKTEQVVEQKPTIKEKLTFKLLLNRMKHKKKRILKKKHSEGIKLAKQSIQQVIPFIAIENEGKELTIEDINNLSDEATIDVFEEVVNVLEENYLGRAK